MMITLLSAGTGTVSRQLGNGLVAFVDHPAQWQALAEDPGLAAQATEEIFRHASVVIVGTPRIATEALTWNGLHLAPGPCLIPMPAAANRDPAVFTDPERFDITRSRKPQLTLGGGMHYCLGAALGRAELQEALLVLSRGLRDLKRPAAARFAPPTEFIVGPLSLPIRYTASD